jgi:hypothetical protein
VKTYQKIFENALRKLNLSKKDVKDYRPASEIHIPEIKGEIEGGIVIWTNDGREILYREKCTKRFIEVDTADTIGDLILRLTGGKEPPMSFRGSALRGQTLIYYYIDDKTWRSRIPANVLYPEGSDYT